MPKRRLETLRSDGNVSYVLTNSIIACRMGEQDSRYPEEYEQFCFIGVWSSVNGSYCIVTWAHLGHVWDSYERTISSENKVVTLWFNRMLCIVGKG